MTLTLSEKVKRVKQHYKKGFVVNNFRKSFLGTPFFLPVSFRAFFNPRNKRRVENAFFPERESKERFKVCAFAHEVWKALEVIRQE